MAGILKGMRVVEGSAFVAIPLAGMTLAQMGADVIRFDRLEGGLDAHRWPITDQGRSLFWAGMNKGKRSVAVDMKSPRGRELVTQIITAPGEDAGLFLTNLRVRGWMDHPTLSEFRRDLVMVTLSGDRQGRPAVDYTVNPALGFPDATGPTGSSDPVAHVLPAWDCIAGNLAVSALLAAERHRLKTGAGQDVDLSLKDVAAAMLGHLGIIGEVVVNGVDRPKSGNALYGAYGQDFICADGRRIMVIGLTDRQWRGLVKVTGSAGAIEGISRQTGLNLSREAARWEARALITEALMPWFAARTLADIAPLFEAEGLTWSEFRSFARAVREDPDLQPGQNPMFADVNQPGIGRYPVPASPLTFSAAATPEPAPAPILGAHTEEVLADVAGLASGEIAQLFDQGIVAGPR
ncbi:MAG: CoA transferase [Paracoccaceae bacterium]|uniref:CoA transferase n=1 Tax=Seohaeicola saemankumensis TaxID=481181 RepID=UPI001E39C36D|nr:CoA transferase [Seohaeicola saemankumensis]MCD1627092.1 CoA transferase [Seohaeicola saemankumensis]